MDQSLLTIKDRIELEQKKWLESKLFRGRWKSIRASGIGDICTRRIFYYMTCGELADEITTDLVAIFEEGKDQEPGVRRFLSELGFEINKSGTTETMDTHGISGQVDGTLVVNGTRYIVEIKTVSEFAWEKLNEPKDLDEGYYKKWYAQMQTYLMLFNYERGLFILKRKAAKQVKVIEIELDYAFAEGLLKKAETVLAAIKANEPPDFLAHNPGECKKCPFFSKVCNPPFDFGETVMNIDDVELEAKLKEREALEESSKEFALLDKEIKGIKDHFPNLKDAFCGPFHINIKEQTRKAYAVPDEIKEQYAAPDSVVKIVKIERVIE